MDGAGHNHGYFTPAFYKALQKEDQYVGQIVRALEEEARALRLEIPENWDAKIPAGLFQTRNKEMCLDLPSGTKESLK
ncbi:hypothetical protein [Brevibacillus sp. NRS-1366]|uniref:hypothetical protein n=1 Tax=Brevibacillus sp. NRS-1366 TaxID=3233899 RepID=UPI003D1F8D79